jgi:hypothetical protein
MIEKYGWGLTIFFFLFAAAIGFGLAGAPLKKDRVPQGAFNFRAGLFGAVFAAIGAGIGELVSSHYFGFFIGAFVGGIIGGLLGGAGSPKK